MKICTKFSEFVSSRISFIIITFKKKSVKFRTVTIENARLIVPNVNMVLA